MGMATGSAYISGRPVEKSQPLGRFLPLLPEGIAAQWLAAHLKNEGEAPWVIDPFGASPQLAVEIARQGCRVLVAANNPVMRFLLEMAAHPPAADELRAALAELAGTYRGDQRMEPYLRNLYLTPCSNCGRDVMATAFLWERDAQAPYARIYTCPYCGDTGERPAVEEDAQRARLDRSGMHRSRALERVAPLNDPDRTYAEEALNAYLPRAVFVLLTLINKLENISPARRNGVLALLLAACDRGNNLWPVGSGRPRPRQLVTPPRFIEHNLWLALEEAVESWSGPADEPAAGVPLTIWPELPPDGGGICIFEGRIRGLGEAGTDSWAPDAVVSALPRPNQAFWTLSALWAGWLWGAQETAPFKSVLRRRRYDWSWHSTALSAALRHLAPLLKPGTPFFALLGEYEPGFLAAALVAAGKAGFDLTGIALRPGDGLAQLTLRCGEQVPPAVPEEDDEQEPGAADEKKDSLTFAEMRRLAEQAGEAHLQERAEPAAYAHMHAAALAALAESRELAEDEQSPSRALTLVQNAVHSAFTQSERFVRYQPAGRAVENSFYWLVRPGGKSLPLSDRVEMWLVRFLQKEPGCDTYEIDQALCAHFRGLFTPSRELLQVCLQSYAQESASGGWELNAADTPAIRRAEIEELRSLLLQIGAQLQLTAEAPGERSVVWKTAQGDAAYTFHLQASAVLGDLPAGVIIVHPEERLELLVYKLEHSPHRPAETQHWRFLSFGRLRHLAAAPDLTLQAFEEQLRLDPLTGSSEQMQLF